MLAFSVYTLPQRPAYFNGKTSYVSYRQLADNKRSMKFAMEFRAEKENGVLLYSQGPKGVRDYFMIALQNRKVVVRLVMPKICPGGGVLCKWFSIN